MPDFRSRLRYDKSKGAYFDGASRYALIRTDALMGLFRLLDQQNRFDALTALSRSVAEHGGKSIRTYQEQGAKEASALYRVIEETAPQIGWGIWQIREEETGQLMVSVMYSPFVEGFGQSDEPVCAGIWGILHAIGEAGLGGPVAVSEEHCVARDGGDSCLFRVSPRG